MECRVSCDFVMIFLICCTIPLLVSGTTMTSKGWRVIIKTLDLCDEDKNLLKVDNLKMTRRGRTASVFKADLTLPIKTESPISFFFDAYQISANGMKTRVVSFSYPDICTLLDSDDEASDETKVYLDPFFEGGDVPKKCPFDEGSYKLWNVTYDIHRQYDGPVQEGSYWGRVVVRTRDGQLGCLVCRADFLAD